MKADVAANGLVTQAETPNHRMARALAPARVLLAFAGLVVLVALPLLSGQAITLEATGLLIFVLFAVGLNVVVGGAGMISMGHAALFAIGGYVAGYANRELGWSFAACFAAGTAAAVLGATLIGSLCVRLSHAYFIMLTLAFGQLVHTIIWKWRPVTGGDDGFVGIKPPASLADTQTYYVFTAIVVVVCVYALWRFNRSPMGALLAATRDNPARAQAIGVNLYRHRLAAFAISGMFCGIAGCLQAFFTRGMFADSANFTASANALVAILIGGSQTFLGPVLGGFVFFLFRSIAGHYTPYWPLLLGVLVCTIAMTRPDGILVRRAHGSGGGA